MSQDSKLFFAVFAVLAFVMKIIAEFVHEVLGHGSFVLLFGGEITDVHISVLWPYVLSDIHWTLPIAVTATQLAWIYAGGILACLSVSFTTQILLLLKKKLQWVINIALFWIAFWTFVNSAGYLIIGGLAPFGDIHELIALGVLTKLLSFILGLTVFGISFVALSWVLRKSLLEIFPAKKPSLSVAVFWFILPALVLAMLANPEHSLQVAYVLLAFIPVVLSFAIEYFWVLSKQKTNKNPNEIT
jgi:hypothetical protein